MKRIGFVGIIAIVAFTLVGTVSAQKRTSKRPAAKPVPVKAVLLPLDVRVGNPQALLGEIADDSHDSILADAPAVSKLLEPALRALADEDVDRPLALQQLLDEVAPDEARGTGDEVVQVSLPGSKSRTSGESIPLRVACLR